MLLSFSLVLLTMSGRCESNPIRHSRRRFAVYAIACSIAGMSFADAAVAATNPPGDLMFYRAKQGDAAYVDKPNQYQRLVVPPGVFDPQERIYSVERTPAWRIPVGEIRSVVAERHRPDSSIEKLSEDFARRREGGGQVMKNHPDDNTLTFTFTPAGGARFRRFANQHLDESELFVVTFAGQRLGVASFLGPFERDDFFQFATRDTIDRLKKRYPGLKDLRNHNE
jgi:hypothetical protein